MARYVLGDEGARKFKKLTQLELDFNSTSMYGKTHALDNAYPHPYEVRWSNSLLSTNGTPGGYMMWLPDNCLYVDLSCVPTAAFPQIDGGGITPLEQGSKWYKLTPSALSVSGNEWPSEFDIWLNNYLSAPSFAIVSVDNSELPDESKKASSIHITHINNYRPCASVKSSIVIGSGDMGAADEHSVGLSGDSLSSSPPNLSTEYHIWHFHDNENDLSIQTLVEGNAGTTWLADGLDLVLRDQRGEASHGYKNEVVYLPFQDLLDKFQQDWGDGGEGGKNPTSALNVDEQSVSKGGDGWQLSSQAGMLPALHMWHFHDGSADVDNPEMCDIVLRYNPERASDQKWLRYISYEDLKAKLSSDIGGGGGDNKVDTSLSNLNVDEQSVSKGGDGWALSSGESVMQALHMWHFHDSQADVQNPEMCDFVLRYNPTAGSSDKWLRYCSLENIESKLSSDTVQPITDVVKATLSGDLSATCDSGMFKWTPDTRTIGPGGCMVGRQWVTATGTGVAGRGDYLWSLCVTISNTGSVSAKVVSDAPLGKAPTTTQCWIPIYQIINGKIGVDYRGAFVVPAYE